MKISTIIPVYNTAKYLRKCIDSIINQSIGFENIELILVNDGSTDESETIILEYQKKYQNIKYIYQENGGQASARNNGLNCATGDYVSFVDSDDYIKDDMYEKLLMASNNENFDIIVCNFCYIFSNKIIEANINKMSNPVKNFIITNTTPCNFIAKRKFLFKNNFKFPEGIIYEDLASIPALAIMTNKIFYVKNCLYCYLQRENSTVNNNNYNDKFLCIYIALENLNNIFKQYNKYEEFYEELEYLYIYNLILLSGGIFIKFKETHNEIFHIREIMKSEFPNWKKNKYYKDESFVNKLNILLLYGNHKILFKIVKKLRNGVKRLGR